MAVAILTSPYTLPHSANDRLVIAYIVGEAAVSPPILRQERLAAISRRPVLSESGTKTRIGATSTHVSSVLFCGLP